MIRRIALDTGPLGMIAHPKENKAATEWFRSMIESGCEVLVPEIADYEVRRNLILEELTEGIKRLDQLRQLLTFLPIDTATMRKAASFWADARRQHKPTADKHALDGDAILAAQATLAGAIVATDNVAHLGLFVQVRRWSELGYAKDDNT